MNRVTYMKSGMNRNIYKCIILTISFENAIKNQFTTINTLFVSGGKVGLTVNGIW